MPTINEMSKHRASILAAPRAFGAAFLCLAAFVFAGAQIGGPGGVRKTAGNEAKPAPASFTRRFEKEGVAVEFTLKTPPGAQGGLLSGADAVATFNITDRRTGQPLAGLHPNAWMSALKPDQQLHSDAECKDKIRGFMGGLLSTRAEIDLNSYLALTLNHDNTITFINPQVSFNITKMESLIQLPGAGADWVLSRDKAFLYVTMPDQSAIAVINVVTRKLAGAIPTGEGTRPRRLVLAPDGRRLWVGLDGATRVAVVDTAENKLHATVEVGRGGLHSIALTHDGRFAYITSSDGDSVAAVDARALRKLADIQVGRTPGPVAYSTASGNVYVAAINGASVSVIAPEEQRVVARATARPGIVALRFEPQGRYAFAVNQADSTVSVLDTATNKWVGSTGVVKSPDQVAFSAGFAYIRGTGSEKFSLLNVREAAGGNLARTDIQAGRRPPADSPEDIGVADMIAPTPEGNSALIANAPDQMLYFYMEGMMAPMGTLSNYKRRPRALMVLDRSLKEISPGVYSTPLKLHGAGRFAVSFLLDQPRVVNCFELEVAASPDAEKQLAGAPLVIAPEFKGARVAPSQPFPLRFKIKDPATGRPLGGLKDVQVLVFQPPGVWQQRQWAKEAGGGTYEITQVFPHAGLFKVMFQVTSRGARYRDLLSADVVVVEKSPSETKPDDE